MLRLQCVNKSTYKILYPTIIFKKVIWQLSKCNGSKRLLIVKLADNGVFTLS